MVLLVRVAALDVVRVVFVDGVVAEVHARIPKVFTRGIIPACEGVEGTFELPNYFIWKITSQWQTEPDLPHRGKSQEGRMKSQQRTT